MNPFVAYCQIAEYLVNRKFFVPEEISGKTVLLIGGNSVRTNVAQKQTPCEVLRRYFLANGAEKCLAFDPLPIYYSAEQAAIEE